MLSITVIVAKTLAAILIGVFEGNGAVYIFNRIPPTWFCDYGCKPTEEMISEGRQRVTSHPWKYILTILFIVVNIGLSREMVGFAIASSLLIWLLILLSMGDIKYKILPDQLIILVLLCAVGFYPYIPDWRYCLYGGLVGGFVVFLTALLEKLTYRREAIGGGDIKLYAALGVILGPMGILISFAIMAFVSAGHLVFLLALKKIKPKDTVPMVPYITVSVIIYQIFLWGYIDTLII